MIYLLNDNQTSYLIYVSPVADGLASVRGPIVIVIVVAVKRLQFKPHA